MRCTNLTFHLRLPTFLFSVSYVETKVWIACSSPIGSKKVASTKNCDHQSARLILQVLQWI